MKRLINRMMGAVKLYTPFDFAIFKIYIFAIGILFGFYFAPFWAECVTIVWGVAVVSCVVVITQLIRYAIKKRG